MGEDGVGSYSPPSAGAIVGVLRQVVVKHTFVVIGAQWLSWMVTMIALDLPIQAAYFPKVHHRYFKSKTSVSTWNSPAELLHATVDKKRHLSSLRHCPVHLKVTTMAHCLSCLALDCVLGGSLVGVFLFSANKSQGGR